MTRKHQEDALTARCRAEEDVLAELRCVLRKELLRYGFPLPRNPRVLVDAVVVFGKAGDLRAELRLMPALD